MVFYKNMEMNASLQTEVMSPARSPQRTSNCPTPVFFFNERTFSTKKEKRVSRLRPPPTPRPRSIGQKSCPAVQRFYPHIFGKAQSVSFLEGSLNTSKLESKFYDESSNSLYFTQCFDVVRKIGSGSFGEVYDVKSKDDGKSYAIKRSKEKFKGKMDRSRKHEEVKKHEKLPKHQNCVQFYKAWEERGYLYIQTELCGKSLSEYTEINHDIPESTVWNYLVDLLLAVKHLHDHNLVHLDIKPENIFISCEGICKLGDFGLVLDLSKSDDGEALEGDPKYLAPELMQGKFTKAADIFSLGITILELACDLDLPRGDTTWHQLREGEIPIEFTKPLSPALTEVICKMMEPDYEKRPTVDDILKMDDVIKVLKRRQLFLQIKSMLSIIFVAFHWLVLICCRVKSFLLAKLPIFQKQTASNDITPVRKEQRPPFSDFEYSFSEDDDEQICTNGGMDSDGDDVLNVKQRYPAKDFLLNRHKTQRSFNRLALTTPPDLRYFDEFNDDPTASPNFSKLRPRMSSSPKSTRRSPQVAAVIDTSPNTSLGPRNLMDAFEEDSSENSS